MATPFELRHLSVLALVASDAAYKSKPEYDIDRLTDGLVYLESLPDSSSSANEEGVPASLLNGLPSDVTDLTAYRVGNRGGVRGGGAAETVTFFNWSMIKKFQVYADGFGAAIFRSVVPNAQGKHDTRASVAGRWASVHIPLQGCLSYRGLESRQLGDGCCDWIRSGHFSERSQD